MQKMPWVQELMWVRKNEHGVIVGISAKAPKTDDFIPTVPRKSGYKEDYNFNQKR